MVEGYTGRPGAGKTTSMVWALWKAHKRGRRVRANIPLIDRRPNSPTYGLSWASGPRLETLEEAMQENNCIIGLDEVHIWAPSQEWEKVPKEMKIWLAQHRKGGLDIWWTAQNAARVYNVIRELTATIWDCRRWGALTVLEGEDPASKQKMGRRYQLIRPEIVNLFDTAFMVGTHDGAGAGRGQAERYQGDGFDIRMVDALVRRESSLALPVYEWVRVPCSDLAHMGEVLRTAPVGTYTSGEVDVF